MTYKKICELCGINFETDIKNQKFCCKKCAIKYNNSKKKTPDTIKICKMCGVEFLAKHLNKLYCSEFCKKEASDIVKRKSYFKHRDKIIKKHKLYNIKNKEKLSKYFKQYRKNNLEKRTKYEKEYYKKNRKKILKLCAIYSEKNKEKRRAQVKKWYLKNIEKIRKQSKERYKSSPDLTAKRNIRRQIHRGIKNKDFTTFELLDYSGEELRLHLESKFKENMSWENYGVKGWHIDHIRPIASFNFINNDGSNNLEQIKLCWSLDNLQPLWASENCSKGAKYNKNGKIVDFRKSKKKDV